jgi:hypothetical protein
MLKFRRWARAMYALKAALQPCPVSRRPMPKLHPPKLQSRHLPMRCTFMGCATRIGSVLTWFDNWKSGWWARQDSNLQPDRYERPALTIELQALPRKARVSSRRGCMTVPSGAPSSPGPLPARNRSGEAAFRGLRAVPVLVAHRRSRQAEALGSWSGGVGHVVGKKS